MVPLDEAYSYDAGNIVQKNADKVPINSDGLPIVYKEEELTKQQLLIVKYLQKYENITSGKAQSIR
jgi:hypothetical protein